jgi:hypothetical protein
MAAAVALLPILPALGTQLGLDRYAWYAGALAVAAGVTRVLAMPAVERWLGRFVPWLAAQPASPGPGSVTGDTTTPGRTST